MSANEERWIASGLTPTQIRGVIVAEALHRHVPVRWWQKRRRSPIGFVPLAAAIVADLNRAGAFGVADRMNAEQETP